MKSALNRLWESTASAPQVFDPRRLTHLPDLVQRYLNHSITPGTPLASAVHLRMHGQIKLNAWSPFQAEQVIAWNQGMIWSATAWMKGLLPVRGADSLINGCGDLRWKLLGLIPVMTAKGTDITRSIIGRMQGESIWLPSVLANPDRPWTVINDSQIQTPVYLFGETTPLQLTLDDRGRLQFLDFQRWGNPDESHYRYCRFAGIMHDEEMVAGYRIPSRFSVGWGIEDLEMTDEQSFFRATLDSITYR
ncbi:hypothetical protein E1H12_05570 [Geitlerinema sp. P-1104]|uniref:DUF6920 family protein n=1 Tax=Geitlerinema sp. P-1104 TaxID=2546230 RepID=UPI001476858B|nr:DUF6544 family protein [Geitlerinema sp. P-1104]NMG58009.1 hypothetical protein [Geitlerinema sp. P-1104]